MSAGVQVTIPNKPPAAVLSVSPLSGPAPLNVTASAAGSSDPDGSIVSTAINFGDGSALVNAVSASHTYATAGTFTVTATVTDNLGAIASKATAVQVTSANKPPIAALTVTPTSGYAPVTVTASTAGSSDPDGTVANSVINWGDGTSAAGPSATHVYSTAGTYAITATVTDNQGAKSSTAASVTVQAPQVVVKSPVVTGSSVPLAVQTMNSPLHVVASGFSGLPVTAMQIYLDGTLVYTVSANAIDTSVVTSPGTHAFVIKAWDNSGRSFSSNFSVTVNAPPVAALTVNSTSLLVGGSITASAAGSTDTDGTIASTTINFGDGTVLSGASGTHQYTAAGTYTITATVADNAGASSSKSQSITVKPQFTTITGPTVTSTTASSVVVSGSSFSGYPIVATQIYVDGALKLQTKTASASTTVSLAVGTHLIVVQGWDASGAVFKSSMSLARK